MKACCIGEFVSAFRCSLRIRCAVRSFSPSDPIDSRPRALLDHNDVIVEINYFQAVTLDRFGGNLLARRDSHNVARLQLCIVPYSSYSRRPSPRGSGEDPWRLCARVRAAG